MRRDQERVWLRVELDEILLRLPVGLLEAGPELCPPARSTLGSRIRLS